MGVLVNKPLTTVAGVLAAAVILGLNVYLIYQTFAGG
jgi:Mn2+/Fe2+ NRAMP family transporter